MVDRERVCTGRSEWDTSLHGVFVRKASASRSSRSQSSPSVSAPSVSCLLPSTIVGLPDTRSWPSRFVSTVRASSSRARASSLASTTNTMPRGFQEYEYSTSLPLIGINHKSIITELHHRVRSSNCAKYLESEVRRPNHIY